MKKINTKRNFIKYLIVLLVIGIIIAFILNRQWIYDYFRGLSYRPSQEMSLIREKLNLTDQGNFLFNSALPELDTNEEFNSYCRTNNEEGAILGCYVNDNMYIYNIVDERLNGIRELTTAHELLHVLFARLSEGEKEELKPFLEKVYKENQDILDRDLEIYEESERFEELYVRAGTEIKDLPDKLEKHFSKVFNDQDLIVSFYDSYIAVFREIETELDNLISKIESTADEIEQKTEEYKRRVNQLNADIVSFNSCAEVPGCFKDENVFNMRRNALINEQNYLEEFYNNISDLVNKYNEDVELYNADVLRSEELEKAINSNIKPNEL